MGKNKLKRFEELKSYPNVLQPNVEELLMGKMLVGISSSRDNIVYRNENRDRHKCYAWGDIFGNTNRIVLELGCGKGEYVVNLARMNRDINYIGIDIKGARIWKGATIALNEGLRNVLFVRTYVEMLPYIFREGDVSEIWITFPEPEPKKERKRFTHKRYLNMYRRILCKENKIHLKTDSEEFYLFTLDMLNEGGCMLHYKVEDIYNEKNASILEEIKELQIRTFYEDKWLLENRKIYYICFSV